MLNTILLALRLLAGDPDMQAAAECNAQWEADSDAWHDCHDGLRTWACEAQGTCLVDGDRPTMRVMLVPDPAWAGRHEWI